MMLNLPRWTEYQLVVLASPQDDGEASFRCLCRPRNRMANGPGISHELAQKVCSELLLLIRSDPLG